MSQIGTYIFTKLEMLIIYVLKFISKEVTYKLRKITF